MGETLNVQPAYAEGFGVAGAHLSRRSESEGGTPNIQFRNGYLARLSRRSPAAAGRRRMIVIDLRFNHQASTVQTCVGSALKFVLTSNGTSAGIAA
jgi:hypothetical protein